LLTTYPTTALPLRAGRSSGHPRVLFVGSYPPRECGIATFMEDIRGAYDRLTGTASDVIAVEDLDADRLYPKCVIGTIACDDAASYVAAARLANASDADVVNVQHEYGLYGSDRGSKLLGFLEALRRPAVITLHTTLPEPDAVTHSVTQALCSKAEKVMVLTETSGRILTKWYGVDPAKIRVVMHGVPDVKPYHGPFFKRVFGLGEGTVISTFGLLSRGKGIETIIEALPAVIKLHPDVTYVLWGETHPEVRRREGERYRSELRDRAEKLGVSDHVRFFARYLTDDEVVSALLATDVYVSPSLDPHQAVSGTLSYALACGRAVIATAYQYAKELLSDGRGITFPFRDAAALGAAVISVLDDATLRTSLETAAYRFGRGMTWPKIALGYRQAFSASILADLRVAPAALGA
jgi:glycosyltransferase involved in cell wall biosynthesis